MCNRNGGKAWVGPERYGYVVAYACSALRVVPCVPHVGGFVAVTRNSRLLRPTRSMRIAFDAHRRISMMVMY